MGKGKILKTIYCTTSFIGESRRRKIIITESTSAVACDQGLGRGLAAKGHEETFQDGNILYHECGGDS